MIKPNLMLRLGIRNFNKKIKPQSLLKEQPNKKLSLGIGYFGAKHNQSQFLSNLYTKGFDTYMEPFGGTYKNFINGDLKCNAIYNDFNFLMVNLMLAYSNASEFILAFEKEMESGGNLHCPFEFVPENRKKIVAYYKGIYMNWREKFLQIKEEKEGNYTQPIQLTDVKWEYAVMYAFCLAHAYNGMPLNESFMYSKKKNSLVARFQNTLRVLRQNAIHFEQKLKDVPFYHANAIDILKLTDSPIMQSVIDPPYIGYEHLYNDGGKEKLKELTLSDFRFHIGLAQTLKNLEGKWILCYYYHPFLDKLYPRDKYLWLTKDYKRTCANAGGSDMDNGTELMILNYTPDNIEHVKTHLKEEASKVFPIGEGKGRRYSIETKRRVIEVLENKVFKTKKALMDFYGIGSYTTLSKWVKLKQHINRACYWWKRAKKYRTHNIKKFKEAIANLINDRWYGIGLAIRDILSIKTGLAKNEALGWYEKWKSILINSSRKRKINRWFRFDKTGISAENLNVFF